MSESEFNSSADEQETGGGLDQYVPADLLNVTFPISVRGYDRATVDAYVSRVGHVVAELKLSSSPPAAVRHALDRAGQQVQRLLQSARQTAGGRSRHRGRLEPAATSARRRAHDGARARRVRRRGGGPTPTRRARRGGRSLGSRGSGDRGFPARAASSRRSRRRAWRGRRL